MIKYGHILVLTDSFNIKMIMSTERISDATEGQTVENKHRNVPDDERLAFSNTNNN